MTSTKGQRLVSCKLLIIITLFKTLLVFEPHLHVIAIKSHNRSKEEEREVEVVFQEVGERVVAVLPVTVLQSKTHAAHDAEATAAVEQDVLKVERTRHQVLLQRGQSAHLRTHTHTFTCMCSGACLCLHRACK